MAWQGTVQVKLPVYVRSGAGQLGHIATTFKSIQVYSIIYSIDKLTRMENQLLCWARNE